MDEAVHAAVLAGRFSAPDDGSSDDARCRCADGRCRLPAPQRPCRVDLGFGRQAQPSVAGLCDVARLSRHATGVSLAIAGRHAAGCRQRPGADDRGPRCRRQPARLVCAVVELCRGHPRPCRDQPGFRCDCRRLPVAGRSRPGVGGRYRPDVHFAGRAGVRWRRRALAGAGDRPGAIDGPAVRRVGVGARGRRCVRAAAPAAHRERL